MSTILVVDDEPQIRRMLRVILESDGYCVIEAAAGNAALIEAATRRPDAIILDLGLPDLSGQKVLCHLREWNTSPVLILSALDGGEDKVTALDAGADDYVTKPFDARELLARLRVLLRRIQPKDEPVMEYGSLQIDYVARLVRVNGKEIDLTTTEYSLLRVLARHAGKIVTQKYLLSEVWGPNAIEQSQYLRVYFSHIRRKLSAHGFPAEGIRTETGVGYRLIPPE